MRPFEQKEEKKVLFLNQPSRERADFDRRSLEARQGTAWSPRNVGTRQRGHSRAQKENPPASQRCGVSGPLSEFQSHSSSLVKVIRELASSTISLELMTPPLEVTTLMSSPAPTTEPLTCRSSPVPPLGA